MHIVLLCFAVACSLYVLARMVSAPVSPERPVHLHRCHADHGRKYAALFAGENGASEQRNVPIMCGRPRA
jgi:hypothetical protein